MKTLYNSALYNIRRADAAFILFRSEEGTKTINGRCPRTGSNTKLLSTEKEN
jgi:hypothetical protein